jgi:integrase
LGLLTFVEQLRERGESRLFPELPVRRDGASQNASLWFGRYRTSIGLYGQKPKKDFHSFRTTFINTLKQKGVPEPEVATLVGHAIETQTFGRYGKPYTPEVMLTILRQVDFSSVLEEVRVWH